MPLRVRIPHPTGRRPAALHGRWRLLRLHPDKPQRRKSQVSSTYIQGHWSPVRHDTAGGIRMVIEDNLKRYDKTSSFISIYNLFLNFVYCLVYYRSLLEV